MRYKVLITFIVLLSFFTDGNAQTGRLFNADNQLSSSLVNQVFLDRDGFIWVVTRNGLCRYDGYSFNILKKEQEKGMASNYVNCMTQDGNGLFYLGMFGAFQTYDGVNFKDVKCKDLNGNVTSCYITCFAELKSGAMLVGTSGRGLLVMDSPTEAHQVGGDLAKVETVSDMIVDSRQRIWIVTDKHGVLVFDGKRVTAAYFRDEQLRYSVHRVCEDREGRIYIGTSDSGVYRMETDGTFRHIDVTGKRNVMELYCRGDGQVIVGYDGNGMSVYNPKTGTLTDNPDYSFEVDLSQAKITSVVEDPYGNLWIGMLQKGVYMRPALSDEFGYMGYRLGVHNIIGQACVTSTLVDSKGRVFLGTDKDGLYVINNGNITPPTLIRHYKENFPATILTMAEDRHGRVWIGTFHEGLGYIDPADGEYHSRMLPQGRKLSVFGIAADARGNLWLATMGSGLLRLSLADGKVKTFAMKREAEHDRTADGLANNFISKLSLSHDGKKVLLATTQGLCCYDMERDSWTSTFGTNCLLYGMPTRVVKEYDGRLWIGTNYGLYCYDLLSRKTEVFTQENGLVDNGVCAIEQDRRGWLWVATDHGLCCYDPKTGRMESYFVDNGLQSNEFSDGASFASGSGKMLFGGMGGITWFDPEKIDDSKWNATVKLTAFIVNGVPVNSRTMSDGRQVCDTTVIAADRFTLGYHDNSFTLRFSTLTYDMPEHIAYIYRINDE